MALDCFADVKCTDKIRNYSWCNITDVSKLIHLHLDLCMKQYKPFPPKTLYFELKCLLYRIHTLYRYKVSEHMTSKATVPGYTLPTARENDAQCTALIASMLGDETAPVPSPATSHSPSTPYSYSYSPSTPYSTSNPATTSQWKNPMVTQYQKRKSAVERHRAAMESAAAEVAAPREAIQRNPLDDVHDVDKLKVALATEQAKLNVVIGNGNPIETIMVRSNICYIELRIKQERAAAAAAAPATLISTATLISKPTLPNTKIDDLKSHLAKAEQDHVDAMSIGDRDQIATAVYQIASIERHIALMLKQTKAAVISSKPTIKVPIPIPTQVHRDILCRHGVNSHSHFVWIYTDGTYATSVSISHSSYMSMEKKTLSWNEHNKCFFIQIYKFHADEWHSRGIKSPSMLIQRFRQLGGQIDAMVMIDDVQILAFAELFKMSILVNIIDTTTNTVIDQNGPFGTGPFNAYVNLDLVNYHYPNGAE